MTFNLVAFGLLIFRANSIGDAWVYFAHVASGDFAGGFPPIESALIGLSLGLHIVERWLRRNRGKLQEWIQAARWGSLAEGAALGVVAALTLAAMGSGSEFIYFQF